MKKRYKKIIFSIMVIVGVISVFDFVSKQQEVIINQKSTIAMYIEGEDGEYTKSQDNKFPTEGYVLDIENSSCANGGKLSQNLGTKKIKVNLSNIDSCSLYFKKEKVLLDEIMAKANNESIIEYEKGKKTEMYIFRHDNLTTTTEVDGTTYTHTATQVADWTSEERKDYRYIGSDPNNYIEFNGETWRIIGVFTVEREVEGSESTVKEQLVKIIRNESIGNIPWDDYTDGSSTNEWSTASLQTLLNGAYFNTEDSFSYTYKASNSTATGTTITIPKGLNQTARNQVAKVKWYLGGSSILTEFEGSTYYNFERGEERYNTSRTINIMQHVGLMYPSDYIYTYANGIDDTCYENGWNCDINQTESGWMTSKFRNKCQWVLSPIGFDSYGAYVLCYDGLGVTWSYAPLTMYPTVYLKSGIKIIDGDGSEDQPYQLGL